MFQIAQQQLFCKTTRSVTPGATIDMSRASRFVYTLTVIAVAAGCKSTPQYDPALQQVADDLFATDIAFADTSAREGYFAALERLLLDSARMPIQDGRFATTRGELISALRASTPNVRVNWAPLRVGISANARHGFSYGTMTVSDTTGNVRHARYLAYWIRTQDGWRMAAYRRRFADSTHAQRAVAPWLPYALVVAESDAEQHLAHYRSLVAAEKQFSDESQQIGLGAAFQKFGRVDAINLAPPSSPTFVEGANNIGLMVAGGDPLTTPSPVHWSADTALVASSGDLGVTFGVIRQHNAPSGTPGAAFFTIWVRESPEGPWRYIAE